MFSFLFRKKKPPVTETSVACPDCSALFSRAETQPGECTCPACGKTVQIQDNCGKFT
jgi:ribosomal protein S27E